MTKAVRCLAIVIAIVNSPYIAGAQATAGRMARIGYLDFRSSDLTAFRQGLSNLGYFEGSSFKIEYRTADWNIDRLMPLVSELVRLNVDVIVTSSGQGALRAKKATSTIPIVMVSSADAVKQDIVASLARPGGNVTGLTGTSTDLSGKRLEILKHSFPNVSRVVHLGCRGLEGFTLKGGLKESRAAARALGVELHSVQVQGPGALDLEHAFTKAIQSQAEALLVEDCPRVFAPQQTVDLAAKSRLPTIYPLRFYVVAGGLMFYGADPEEQSRRAAYFVDKILKGAKPGELPVEQPMKFELTVNLKTAQQLGLTIPPKVLMWADRVIE